MYLKFFKPFFDFFVALVMLLLISPVLLILGIILSIHLTEHPIFLQERIGKDGKSFIIFKFKTISHFGYKTKLTEIFRKFKLDELPQLFNILRGEMSVVGPRPDIPGYYDCLEGENRRILKLKPGLTGCASLAYYNEEEVLANVDDPKRYNDEVIFPKKIELNLWYLNHISFQLDLKLILKTLFLPFRN